MNSKADTPTKAVYVRLSSEAHAKLEAFAERNKRSRGAEAGFRLEEQLRKEKPKT